MNGQQVYIALSGQQASLLSHKHCEEATGNNTKSEQQNHNDMTGPLYSASFTLVCYLKDVHFSGSYILPNFSSQAKQDDSDINVFAPNNCHIYGSAISKSYYF